MVLMYIFNITSGNKMTFQDYMLKKEIMSKSCLASMYSTSIALRSGLSMFVASVPSVGKEFLPRREKWVWREKMIGRLLRRIS